MAMKIPAANKKPSNLVRLSLFWFIVAMGILIGITYLSPQDNLKVVPISDVINRANNGQIAKLDIQGDEIKVTVKDGKTATEKTTKQADSSIQAQGLKADAPVEIAITQPSTTGDTLWNLAIIIVPTILIIGFFTFMMRQAQGQNNQALGFGKSKAKLYGLDKEKVVFTDIAGNESAKQDLEEVVDFLKHPKKYEALGAKIPRGVLLVGSPGTGKTMLARAVAGEANVPFFSISGSEFVEMFVGVGASRVRDLFAKAKKNAPAIIFIDEIDAVGRRRGSGMGGGHDEREQTLNQILVEMDGFDTGANVIVLAATNRADVLDPALLRPGRFDRRTNILLPERRDRLAILKVHFKNKPVDATVNMDALAAKTAGSSGADLANITNEAAIVAARRNSKKISNNDLTQAFEKIAIGPERKAKIMNDREKEMTAYHEAGHAIVGHVLPDSDPVHKVTIIPRGGTGGVTWFLPPEDKSYTSIIEFKDVLARALGGRIAEKLVYGKDRVTTGAGSDLRHATGIAREMVIEQGMGTKLRDQVFHEDNGGMMFDRMTHERPYGDDTAREIDNEVADLIKESAKRAEAVITKNRASLDKLAKALLAEETLDEEQVVKILKDTVLPEEAKLY
ncbi:cell division protein FtsH [Candidatus Saccharibacteria bacterium CG11_big_fil_rev_8_21_14_0_20_41_19]|nr:ATP-dependent zinc metalloprotease FtsH [Candidatus Saccharibacteria bacterium]PIQ70586.1 MAG: cell division protein FtsH [Candidatus Saccharibacteria bacterium CG11_big_fil_rev_8_21_14_0_20_41_19]PIZ59627.1 MAG: cell division protein FtsH [Candidatus Saccharibacteria bacterium CG_4_10_14_0_2_um_filter_41_11]PJC29338.1 MAG: cell division protein FtsH [Candidatus Saccharibacteria bacterium CG_4_9_14_0_2_um_filter_41_9]PJE66371.1 MAG: cell division protein FtsH [Candidatus Saccharibacteria bac